MTDLGKIRRKKRQLVAERTRRERNKRCLVKLIDDANDADWQLARCGSGQVDWVPTYCFPPLNLFWGWKDEEGPGTRRGRGGGIYFDQKIKQEVELLREHSETVPVRV